MSENNTGDRERWCRMAIERNEEAWEDFQNGDSGALNFLVGQVMEISGGRADPAKVSEWFRSQDTE